MTMSCKSECGCRVRLIAKLILFFATCTYSNECDHAKTESFVWNNVRGEGLCLHVTQHGSGCAGALTYDDETWDEKQGQQLSRRGGPHCEVVHGTRGCLQDHRDLARQLKSMAWADVGARASWRRQFPLLGRWLLLPNILRSPQHVLSLNASTKGTHTPSDSFCERQRGRSATPPPRK